VKPGAAALLMAAAIHHDVDFFGHSEKMAPMSIGKVAEVVTQLEVFVRTPLNRSFERYGVFLLDSAGQVSLSSDDASRSGSLQDLMDMGVSPRDPLASNVFPSEGEQFLKAVADHFQSGTYHKVRWTTFPGLPEQATALTKSLVLASELVRNGRDLSAAAMPIDKELAGKIESHTKALELLRDQIHESLLTDKDKVNGAVPRSERGYPTTTP